MIRVYPSRLEGEPLETHVIAGEVQLDNWLRDIVGQEISERETQPINVDINGVACEDFSMRIGPRDDVRIYPNVNAGVGIATIAYYVAVGVALIYSIYMISNMPKAGSSTNNQGDDMELATTKANQIKANAVIRESFGFNRIYPDYILPPYKRFFNKRQQFNYFCLSLGVGEYEVQPGRVFIGDTPVSVFGADVEYTLYPPGADLSAEPLADWWHVAPEVGGTTTGNGLDLASTADIDANPAVTSITVDGKNIFTVDPADEWPETWTPGLIVEAIIPQTVLVVPVSGDRDKIEGDFDDLAPFAGMKISLGAGEVGDYTVFSYSPYVPPVPGVGGSPSMVTASASPTTYDFTASPVAFSVTFNSILRNISLNANYVNMSGLISSITTQLSGGGLVAQDDSGRVRLIEPSSPYVGGVITSSGLPASVFGVAPTFTVGTASTGGTAEQAAYITLSLDGGAPVSGLAPGLRRISFAYRGSRYKITARTDTQLTVDRLTDTGVVDAGWAGWEERFVTDNALSTDGEGGTGAVNWIGPFMCCPENELTSLVEYDIFYPGGLVKFSDEGDRRTRNTTIIIEWRDAALGGAWNTIERTYSDRTPDQIGFTHELALPYPMRPEIRIRRKSPVQGGQTRDVNQWYGLRSKLSGPTSYKDVTVLTMKVRGGDRLSQQSENKVSLEALRLIDGAPTRSISDAILYVMNDLGISPANIDLATFEALEATYWTPRTETFDFQYASQQTARDTVQSMLAAGMSNITMNGGKLSAKREGVQSIPAQVISPNQMTSELQSKFASRSDDEYDGVDVEFINSITWAQETVECRLPEFPNPKKIEKIKLDGVTDRTRAWRVGMRQLRKHQLQRWNYQTETELDALECRYLDRIALCEDAVGFSQSALILSVDGDIVETSERIDWTGITNPRVRVRRHDGTATALYTPIRIDDYVMRLPGLDFVPDTSFDIEPCTLIFGDVSRIEYPAMITEISPQSDGTCTVSAVEYTDEIYADDDNAPS